LEFLKTESIDNDPASVVKQKKAFNQQQMLMYDNEELERDLDGDLNLQRLKQATDSLDKLTNHHKKTRTYLDERKSAEDRHEDFQIEEEALAQEERANQKIFDAEVAANVAQKNAKGLKDAQLAKDKLLALDEALAKRFQQEEDDRHSKKRHDAAVKRAVAGNSDDEGRQNSADDSEDGDAKPHNIQFSHRTQKSQDTDTPATKLQNALRNRLAKKELERRRSKLAQDQLAVASPQDHDPNTDYLMSLLTQSQDDDPAITERPGQYRSRSQKTTTDNAAKSLPTHSEAFDGVKGRGQRWNAGALNPIPTQAEKAAEETARAYQKQLDTMEAGWQS